jgi:hypothetical protein
MMRVRASRVIPVGDPFDLGVAFRGGQRGKVVFRDGDDDGRVEDEVLAVLAEPSAQGLVETGQGLQGLVDGPVVHRAFQVHAEGFVVRAPRAVPGLFREPHLELRGRGSERDGGGFGERIELLGGGHGRVSHC